MTHWCKVERDFFARPTLEVARRMLGLYLVHETPAGRRAGRVVETEAYVGPEDRASHAARGLTQRTRVMFGPPGHAYIYLVYGLHCCFNVVTEAAGYPAAVLVRALEPAEGLPPGTSTRGPGLLCRALGIDRRLNGADLVTGALYLEDRGDVVLPADIAAAPRIGVSYAGAWADRPWRFYVRSSGGGSGRGSAGRVSGAAGSSLAGAVAGSSGAPSAR